MSGDDFLEELKRDFLNEASFMMEQYEESMLALESAEDPQEHIGRIFRVAHSIKGGAAAVGFEDLSHFAHKAEDLLSILRVYPEKITTEIITLFLSVGDQFKIRLTQLKSGDESGWDVAELTKSLKMWIERFQPSEEKGSHEVSEATAVASTKVEEFFFPEPVAAETTKDQAQPAEDVTNYELLAELQAELAAQDTKTKTGLSVARAEETPLKVVPEPAMKTPEASTTPAKTGASASDSSGPKKNTAENAILKVDSQRVDAVLDVVGEIVVLKNQLIHSDAVRGGLDQRLNFVVDQIDKSIRDLYERTLGIRMTPLKSLFMKLQRTVRDVSVKLQKPVDLQLVGEDTEVDRSVFELLGDPLMHMARNAMDHGIEPAAERRAAQKPEVARLTISAKQVGGSVVIEISEDGRGIDREKILKKALEKKLIPAGVNPQDLSDEKVYEFLFAPGFSTAEVVTDLSGRGVGLDVVRSNIEKIKGSIRVRSTLGKGTTFQISIPLTTAITDGIVVTITGNPYMIPIHSIREIVQFAEDDVTNIANQGNVLKIRDRITPVMDLGPAFQMTRDLGFHSTVVETPAASTTKTYVVLESSHGLAALPVDEVIGQSQVVAKPLMVGVSVPEFSGAATLGDGRTILILDPTVLTQGLQRQVSAKGAA